MSDAPEATMTGRICLVTGATNGIGRATAQALAARGASVIVHGRDRRKAEAAVNDIVEATRNRAVEPIVGDLAELDQVRRMAAEFRARHKQLHVLLNNAGLVAFDRRTTHDGFEAHFGVNHLAPFLLTNLLLDALKSSAPARVVTVASAVHNRGRIDFDDLQAARSYGGIGAYANSKLANILFTTELARRLDGAGVTANALHPGVVATGPRRRRHRTHGARLEICQEFHDQPREGRADLDLFGRIGRGGRDQRALFQQLPRGPDRRRGPGRGHRRATVRK